MKLIIPKEQLQKNIVLEDGWYKAIFKKMDTKKNTKNPNVTNFYVYFELEKDGREMDTYIAKSDDMRGFAPLVLALDPAQKVTVVEGEVQNNLDFEPDASMGKKLQIKLVAEPWEGRKVSKIKDFLPYDADTNVPFGV